MTIIQITAKDYSPIDCDEAYKVLQEIKTNLAGIGTFSLGGLSAEHAAILDSLRVHSSLTYDSIVEGKPAQLQLPAEDLGAKNQSDWEGQQLAKKIKPDPRDGYPLVGQPQPPCEGRYPIG